MKKKLVIIIGVIIVVLAFIFGGIAINNRIKAKEQEAILVDDTAKEKHMEKITEKIADLEVKKSDLEDQVVSLKAEWNKEFMSNGFSQRYYEIEKELKDISAEISNINSEILTLKLDSTSDEVDQANNVVDDSVFSLTKVLFLVFIVIFVVAVVVIIFGFIKGSKSMMTGKDMLNDLSDVAVKMAKELNPTYKEFKCPNCGAALDPDNADIKKCGYCGAKLYKTVNTNHHSSKTSNK